MSKRRAVVLLCFSVALTIAGVAGQEFMTSGLQIFAGGLCTLIGIVGTVFAAHRYRFPDPPRHRGVGPERGHHG